MRKKSVTLVDKIKKRLSKKGIQFVLAMTFTVVAVICMTLISVILHKRFQLDMRQTKIESTEQIINQVGANLESSLRSMIRISDVMYYSAM